MNNESQHVPLATPVVISPAGGPRVGRHRLPAPPHALRGRAAVLAVAAGAAVSAASAGSVLDVAGTHSTEAGDIALLANGETVPATPAPSTSATASATPSLPEPVVITAMAAETENAQSTMLYAGTEINTQREIAEEQARRPKVAMPAFGSYTSPYAMRWGVMHAGVDIANSAGTEIYAATDGTVIDSGPAQGYGNWIRIMSDDGTMTVYGHMQSLDVSKGERVYAGQKIAGMGSLGFSTGSHLHFEVLVNGGKDHVDPALWLAQQGLGSPGTGSAGSTGMAGSTELSNTGSLGS
ncbi:M23 family metallopeptidase [Rhodococcus sp. IEGM 1408]|uniref:M23 family metallopeptidase n=1 Tax=Rhodococcus sp. IEGM 1408 TaxID=3082220 RepID=UPI0029546E0A|nr:M23 family metallopeptidase [Rhodococcus sp. IEGM 1408]MDV8001155.1 M23 family metallopeptidase [Rhodococcus sp. IEGM 1408]